MSKLPTAELEFDYGYTPEGRFDTLTSSSGTVSSARVFRYGYEPDSTLVKTLSIDGNAYNVTRSFEAHRDILLSIDSLVGSAHVTRYDYTSNALGQRTTIIQSGAAYADYGGTGSLFQKCSYDAKGQLSSSMANLGSTEDASNTLLGRRFEYGYDEIGNRRTANNMGSAGSSEVYTTNAANEYSSKENHALTVSGTSDSSGAVVVAGNSARAYRQSGFWSDLLFVPNQTKPWRGPISIYATKPGAGPGGSDLVRLETRMAQIAMAQQSFSYDQDGNVTNDGIWDYQWDAENRLVRLTTDATAALNGFPKRALEFKYDYQGRRVLKRLLQWNAGANNWDMVMERRFLYDGWSLVGEYSVNTSTGAQALARSYTWGLDIVRTLADAGGVGALVQVKDHASGKSYVPSYDGNGNIVSLTNADTSALAAVYEYSPYGEPLRAQTLDPVVDDQPFRFSTKFTDTETGLVYYGNRYYSPSLGRFINRDPIEEIGGVNLYGFCGNDPVNGYDVLGCFDPNDTTTPEYQRRVSLTNQYNSMFGQGAYGRGLFGSGVIDSLMYGPTNSYTPWMGQWRDRNKNGTYSDDLTNGNPFIDTNYAPGSTQSYFNWVNTQHAISASEPHDVTVNGHRYTVYANGTIVRHLDQGGDVAFTPNQDGKFDTSVNIQYADAQGGFAQGPSGREILKSFTGLESGIRIDQANTFDVCFYDQYGTLAPNERSGDIEEPVSGEQMQDAATYLGKESYPGYSWQNVADRIQDDYIFGATLGIIAHGAAGRVYIGKDASGARDVLDPDSGAWRTISSHFDYVFVIACQASKGSYGLTFLNSLRSNAGTTQIYTTPGKVYLAPIPNNVGAYKYTLPLGWSN